MVADRQRQDERHQDEEIAFPAAPETLRQRNASQERSATVKRETV